MAIIKKNLQTINAGEGVEKRELLAPLTDTVKWRTVWRFIQKLKIKLPYDLAISPVTICPEKTIIQNNTCTPILIATLYSIART